MRIQAGTLRESAQTSRWHRQFRHRVSIGLTLLVVASCGNGGAIAMTDGPVRAVSDGCVSGNAKVQFVLASGTTEQRNLVATTRLYSYMLRIGDQSPTPEGSLPHQGELYPFGGPTTDTPPPTALIRPYMGGAFTFSQLITGVGQAAEVKARSLAALKGMHVDTALGAVTITGVSSDLAALVPSISLRLSFAWNQDLFAPGVQPLGVLLASIKGRGMGMTPLVGGGVPVVGATSQTLAFSPAVPLKGPVRLQLLTWGLSLPGPIPWAGLQQECP